MSFPSQYAAKLWDRLYDCRIPDQITLSPAYLKKFGTHVTGHKTVDAMLSTNKTHVKIPVITILTYFEDGIEVEINSRDDMIQMHKDMEGYLGEWREQLKYALNVDIHNNKQFLLSLEKLSKHIFEKAKPKELIDNLFRKNTFGVLNPLARIEEENREAIKPDYEGISKLVRTKAAPDKPTGRF